MANTVKIIEVDGELAIPLPQDALEHLGAKEGDTLQIKVSGAGFILKMLEI